MQLHGKFSLAWGHDGRIIPLAEAGTVDVCGECRPVAGTHELVPVPGIEGFRAELHAEPLVYLRILNER